MLFGAAGAIFGSRYNVLSALKLPRIPVQEGTLAAGAAITLTAILLGTLIAAVSVARSTMSNRFAPTLGNQVVPAPAIGRHPRDLTVTAIPRPVGVQSVHHRTPAVQLWAAC